MTNLFIEHAESPRIVGWNPDRPGVSFSYGHTHDNSQISHDTVSRHNTMMAQPVVVGKVSPKAESMGLQACLAVQR